MPPPFHGVFKDSSEENDRNGLKLMCGKCYLYKIKADKKKKI